MATVEYTTIESNAYTNIFAILDTRTNIADPRRFDGTKSRKFIYDSDPFLKSINFEDFPYIILKLGMPSYDNISVSSKVKNITWKHEIVVRTTRKGASNSGIDVGRKDMLAICDDLHETFNSASIKQSLSKNSMRFVNLEKVSTDDLVVENREVYESVFELTYRVRLTTSA